MQLLITRPLEQNIITGERLSKIGHSVIAEPLLTITALETPFPDDEITGTILTSINALDALSKSPVDKEMLLFTNGLTTQQAAQQVGFTNGIAVEGTVAELVKVIPLMLQAADPQIENPRLLYPCAQETAGDVPALLQTHNISCLPWPVYQTTPSAAFSDSTRHLLQNGEIDAVLLYSSKTARCFAKLMMGLKWPDVYALSGQIAAQLPRQIQEKANFPDTPNEEALFALLTDYK
ncbi:MAG: hypothetical protein COC23_06540 [Hyphomicrobiales bacterium]|nr:MAG: hypothetical protein COC23_06540 [Hyphomicrobiales bacterium]